MKSSTYEKHGRLPALKGWQKIPLHIVAAAAIAAAITFLALYIQPNSIRLMAQRFLEQPRLILLNFMPVFLITVFLGSLTGNLLYGSALTNLLVCGFSVANRLKCEIRQEPVYPRDLQLMREVGEALNSYDIQLPWKILLVVLVFSLGLWAVGFFLRRWGAKPGLRRFLRWGHTVGSAALAVILVLALYSSHELYISFEGIEFFKATGAYNDLGFPYSFCYYITNNSVDKPLDFNETTAASWDLAETGDGTHLPVNVVVVMSETFTNITDYEAFTYSQEEDPIPFFHQLVERDDVISGKLVVPAMGGGTANIEFDVMTGIQSDSLSDATQVAFRSLSGNLDSIFRTYSEAGYNTSYIHPGYAWFYNRNNIIPWMGADTATFYEDLIDPEWLGSYISDDYTADLIIDRFRQDTADGKLAFNYTTTIQNHISYTLDKYGLDYALPELQCSKPLDQETTIQLEVYIEGLRYADKSLEKLINYFETCGEPVLFVFFGDHYPYLGDITTGYSMLGLDEENLEYVFSLYSPPYLIWANREAKEILDWDNVLENIDIPEYFSAAYLGAALTEITGVSDDSPWFSYVNDLRRDYPVSWKGVYMDDRGSVLYDLPAGESDKILKWRQWAYYRLQCKEIKE